MKILQRNVSLSLNLNNVFDKEYYRSYALASGAWGDGRSFRLAARIDLSAQQVIQPASFNPL